LPRQHRGQPGAGDRQILLAALPLARGIDLDQSKARRDVPEALGTQPQDQPAFVQTPEI
jgi:hypothetical protein